MANIKDYLDQATNSAKKKEEFEVFKKEIFAVTLKWEGGGKLHNVAGDSGGWTIWGIALNKNGDLFKNFDDFKDTTYEEAAAVAYVRYYLAIQAFVLPKEARLMYFDTAYNMGTMRAIKIMQKCAGVSADGVIGPMTRLKMANVTEECLYKERNTFYNTLVRQNIKLQKFIKGWLNRSKAVKDA
jgi:lysozyme family protein